MPVASLFSPAALCLTVLVCIITGFTLAYFKNYKQTTHPTNPHGFTLQELVLLMKGACFHIHHWMWAVLLVICILFGRYVTNGYITLGVVGFLIGLSLEDLLFKDWDVVTNNCHKSQLIEFMRRTEDVDTKYNTK
jgi:hypothetical protein